METKINQFFFFFLFFHGIGLPIAVFESGVSKKEKLPFKGNYTLEKALMEHLIDRNV